MSALGNVTAVLASDVADSATATVPYPAGTDQASLTGTTGGAVAIGENDIWPQDQAAGDGTVAFTFGASNITVTNNSGVTWAAGSTLIASFGETAIDGSYNLTHPKQVQDQLVDFEDRIDALENPT